MWWAWPSLAFLPCTITTPHSSKAFRQPPRPWPVGGGQIVSVVHNEGNHGHQAMPCSALHPTELP